MSDTRGSPVEHTEVSGPPKTRVTTPTVSGSRGMTGPGAPGRSTGRTKGLHWDTPSVTPRSVQEPLARTTHPRSVGVRGLPPRGPRRLAFTVPEQVPEPRGNRTGTHPAGGHVRRAVSPSTPGHEDPPGATPLTTGPSGPRRVRRDRPPDLSVGGATPGRRGGPSSGVSSLSSPRHRRVRRLSLVVTPTGGCQGPLLLPRVSALWVPGPGKGSTTTLGVSDSGGVRGSERPSGAPSEVGQPPEGGSVLGGGSAVLGEAPVEGGRSRGRRGRLWAPTPTLSTKPEKEGFSEY